MIYFTLKKRRYAKVKTTLEMFEGTKNLKSIWDGVKLELDGETNPVVLSSFTHVDPDLPQPKSSTQEIGEEVYDGVVYSISLRKVQLHHTANKGQRWLGVSRVPSPMGNAEGGLAGPRDATYENESTLSLYETCKVRTIKAGTLEKLVEYLVSAFRGNDFTYVTIFLCTYRAFATTKQVLDLLLNMFGRLNPKLNGELSHDTIDDRLELKNTVSSILGAWLDQYSEDFRQAPDYVCLKQLIAYVRYNIPGSDLERRARNLLAQFQSQHLIRTDQTVVDHSSCTLRLIEENSLLEGKPDFLSFRQDMLAEQFTVMDADLFKKVVPYHCLGCIWSQRDKKGKEHLAPTIRATVSQFNRVTNCVIFTCLNDRSLKPQQRAKVLERWIDVARECRILKNFSSLRAILSALQCNAIHRLKKTWDEVSRESFRTFMELSEIFSDENNHSVSRELLIKICNEIKKQTERSKEGTSKFATLDINPKRAQKRQQQQREMGVMQGTIPYLGTFLTDLVMLDTAMKDYLEGGLINFEKRRKEFEVIAQIKLLQSACNNYSFLPDESFVEWFQNMERLTEGESYSLSCEIEPLSDPASNTLKAKKNTGIIKRWSDRQPANSEPCTSVSSHSKSFDQLRCSLHFCGSEAPDSLSVTSAGSSSSDVEEINISIVPDSPDCQEKKVQEEPACSSPAKPTEHCVPKGFWESTSVSSLDTSGIGSASSSMTSTPVSASRAHKRSVSGISNYSSMSLPLYNQQIDDCCIIRVSLDVDNGNLYKSIMVTSQDKTPAVIRKAMAKHNLDGERPEDYELVQKMSEEKELKIPSNANVFYAMNSGANYDFVLKKRGYSNAVKIKHGSSSTLPRMKQKGLKIAKGIF